MILIIYGILFILGLCVGSFLNVVIDRLSFDQSLGGRSKCDHCGKTLHPKNLIPMISYLLQKGKSTCCKKQISLYYPVVELITGIGFLLIIMNSTGFGLPLIISALGIFCCLVVIFFADLKYHIIPDEATAGLVVFSAPLVILEGNILLNIAAGAVFFVSFYALYAITKKKGLGFGDVKLAFAIGWMLSLKIAFIAIYTAFVIGGVLSMILILLSKKKPKSTIAFGPFLVLGVILAILAHFFHYA